MITDNRVKMTVEEIEQLKSTIEHVMTVGHGEIIIKVADHKLVHCKADAQFEFSNGVKKG